MAAHDTSLQEDDSRNAPVSQEATPDPMEAVMRELAELRKVNQKLNERLDNALHPNAKKKLFNERKRSSVDPSCSDAVRKTYKALKQQKDDFTGFLTDARYQDEGNKKVEEVLVKEIRGNFGKKKWTKAEIRGAVHQYWRSIRDDAVRRAKGKYDEHRIVTRRRVRVQRKLNYRQEMVGTATLSPKDKERMTALLSLHNAMEFMSSEESDEGEGEPATGPPPRHVKPLQWERAKLKNIK